MFPLIFYGSEDSIFQVKISTLDCRSKLSTYSLEIRQISNRKRKSKRQEVEVVMIELDFIRNIEKMKIEEIKWIVKTESAMFFLSNSIRPGPRIEFAQYNSNNFGNLNFQKSYFRIFKVHFSIPRSH